MGNWSSNEESSSSIEGTCCKDCNNNGSLRYFTEKIAFPAEYANRRHTKIAMNQIPGVNYILLIPARVRYNFILVYCHGNAMTINRDFCNIMSALSNFLGVEICLIEYPGYGESKEMGTPTADSCVETLDRMIDYLVRVKYEYRKIILFGHSIGTGVVMNYAYQNRNIKFGGIILMAPYKSIIKVVMDTPISSSLTSFDFYRTEDAIAKIGTKICIIHGTLDDVISHRHSKDLFDKIKKKNSAELHILKNTDHTNILSSIECWKKIRDFIDNNKSLANKI